MKAAITFNDIRPALNFGTATPMFFYFIFDYMSRESVNFAASPIRKKENFGDTFGKNFCFSIEANLRAFLQAARHTLDFGGMARGHSKVQDEFVLATELESISAPDLISQRSPQVDEAHSDSSIHRRDSDGRWHFGQRIDFAGKQRHMGHGRPDELSAKRRGCRFLAGWPHSDCRRE